MGEIGLFGVNETPALIGWRPFVDGEFQPDCVRGHCDEGWIERFVRDPNRDGYLIEGDRVRRERIFGRVELLPPEQWKDG